MMQFVLLIRILIDEFQPMKNEGALPSSVVLCGWGDSNPHSGRN